MRAPDYDPVALYGQVRIERASVADLLALEELLRELPESRRGMIVRAVAHHIAQHADLTVRWLDEQNRASARFRRPIADLSEW